MLGSALYGFCATLPGKEVAVGETWKWQGDLLNIYQNDKLTATFTLQEIVQHEGEECARITGEVSGWSATGPRCTVELWYSLSRGLPVKGTHVFTSKSRNEKIETRLVSAN